MSDADLVARLRQDAEDWLDAQTDENYSVVVRRTADSLRAAADCIERLTRELAEARKSVVVQQHWELQTECDRLRAALEEFGRHHESCPLDRYLPSPTRQCNCGFREALAGAGEEK